MTVESLPGRLVRYAKAGTFACLFVAFVVVAGGGILLFGYSLVWGIGAVVLNTVTATGAPSGAMVGNVIKSGVMLAAPGVAVVGVVATVGVLGGLTLLGAVVTDGPDRLHAWYQHYRREVETDD